MANLSIAEYNTGVDSTIDEGVYEFLLLNVAFFFSHNVILVMCFFFSLFLFQRPTVQMNWNEFNVT